MALPSLLLASSRARLRCRFSMARPSGHGRNLVVLLCAMSAVSVACSGLRADQNGRRLADGAAAESSLGGRAGLASSEMDETCPDPVPSSREAGLNQVTKGTRQEVPRVYTSFDPSDYTMDGVLGGGFGRFLQRFRFADIRKRAVKACGEEVADQSWIVFLSFPHAPAASIGFSVGHLAKTSEGWRLWLHCQPNLPPPNCARS